MTEKKYRHMMEQVALSDRKKEEILTMLENQNTQKRRMPKVGTIVLAAALAVGCVLSIAAGLPAQVYNFVAGGSTTVMPGSGEAYFTIDGDVEGPVTAENGRLWFEADGQKMDITDKVDADTPYIYERTDPATGEKGYVVVGGTAEDYGWAEFFMTEDGTCSMVGENFADSTLPVDGKNIPWTELTEEQLDMINEQGNVMLETINHPWLDAALAQLDLEFDVAVVD